MLTARRRPTWQGFVRLKNCWSKVGDAAAPEWKGAWGPASASWQNEQSIAKGLGGKPRDNSFWMRFEDFMAGFNKVRAKSHGWPQLGMPLQM